LRIPERSSEVYQLRQRLSEYEEELNRQRSDIISLRQQVDSTNQAHLRELLAQRQTYEQQLDALRQDGDRSVSGMQYKVSDLMAALSSESDRSARYRQELLSLKAKYNEELEALHRNIEAVVDESEQLKRSTLAQMQEDVNRYQSEAVTSRNSKEFEVKQVKEEYKGMVEELNAQLESSNTRVETLEYELAEARKQLKSIAENYEKELKDLQISLTSTRSIMETQETDLKRLKLAREDARKDARELAKEVAVLELEVRQMKKEKAALHSGNQKMERLLYGKGAKRATSPRSLPKA
jgi:chromosome segregation ATPase